MRIIPTLKQTGIVCMLAMAITACQKEISKETGTGNTNPTGCQLSKITYYDSSGMADDTAGLVYTNNKITRVNFSGYYINLIYTNNRVTRINYFEKSGTPYDFYDSVRYTSAGKIESLIYYSTGSGADQPSGGYVLTYNGDGTTAKMIEKVDNGGTTLEDAWEYAYTYTAQSITKMTVTELTIPLSFPLTYTYDNSTNHFSKFPAEFIFADNIMFGISSVQFGFASPFLFSKNNISSVQGVPVTYVTDSKGNLTEVKSGGIRMVLYEYKCG
jgi:hypothetical protein